MEDNNWNAFVQGEKFSIQEHVSGPLSGLTMSVKDLFDIAGHPTGAGNPDWRSSHSVPLQNADLVQTLIQY